MRLLGLGVLLKVVESLRGDRVVVARESCPIVVD